MEDVVMSCDVQVSSHIWVFGSLVGPEVLFGASSLGDLVVKGGREAAISCATSASKCKCMIQCVYTYIHMHTIHTIYIYIYI